MTATYQDVELIVQIRQSGSQMVIEDATGKIYADGFDPEKANANDPGIRKMHNFGETIGTLVNRRCSTAI